jgi:hypothetical protein
MAVEFIALISRKNKLMKTKMIIRLAVIAKLVFSVLICSYFWQATSIEQIRMLPIQVLIMCVVYIALQMLTRRLSGERNWWDWVYYFGLLCIMVPVSFASEENAMLFHFLTDYGTLLLIVPVLVDGWFIIRSNP